LSFTTHMMAGMDGPHLFEITLKSNDADEPEMVLEVKGDFEAAGAGGGDAGQ
jgi:hypothetical protein